MRGVAAAILIGAGLALLYLGWRASQSGASAVTRLFSGSPTRESVLLLTAGAGLAAGGAACLLGGPGTRRKRRKRTPRRRR